MKPEDKLATRVMTLEALLDAQRAVAESLADRVAPLETELAALREIVEGIPHVKAWRERVRAIADAQALADIEREAARVAAEERAKRVSQLRVTLAPSLQVVAVGHDPTPGLMDHSESWISGNRQITLRPGESITRQRHEVAAMRRDSSYFSGLVDCGRLVVRDPSDDELLRYAAYVEATQ